MRSLHSWLVGGLLLVGTACWAQPGPPQGPPPEAEIAERLAMQERRFDEQLRAIREEWERFQTAGGEMDALVLPPMPGVKLEGEFWGGVALVAKVLPFPLGPDQAALIGPRAAIAALRFALSHTVPELAPVSIEWRVQVYVLADELKPPQGDETANALMKETGFRGAQLVYAPLLKGREGERSEIRFEGGAEGVGHMNLQLTLDPRRTAKGEVECRANLDLGLDNIPAGRFRHVRLSTTLVTPADKPVWVASADALTNSAIALALTPRLER